MQVRHANRDLMKVGCRYHLVSINVPAEVDTDLKHTIGFRNFLAELLVLHTPVHNTPLPLWGGKNNEDNVLVQFHQITLNHSKRRGRLTLVIDGLNQLLRDLGLSICKVFSVSRFVQWLSKIRQSLWLRTRHCIKSIECFTKGHVHQKTREQGVPRIAYHGHSRSTEPSQRFPIFLCAACNLEPLPWTRTFKIWWGLELSTSWNFSAGDLITDVYFHLPVHHLSYSLNFFS